MTTDRPAPRQTSGIDPLTREQRRLNMSRIRGEDTKPELLVRKGLHARGLRYRLHDRKLPGAPDLVFPGQRAVVFVHGCFWHGHDCPQFRLPTTRAEFWADKISKNRARDAASLLRLADMNWRTLVVWECALRGAGRRPLPVVVDEISKWLSSGSRAMEVAGDWEAPPTSKV